MTGRSVAVAFFASMLLLSSPFVSLAAETRYSIQLQGLTWNHTILRTLVVPQPSQPWWRPGYVNATLRAINQWNHAILAFSGSNASFSYLSKLRFTSTVGESMEPGYHVYISWTEAYQGTHTLGSSEGTYLRPCTNVKDVVYLGARITGGLTLNEADMQNVALHELGHVLGLGHSNHPDDVMAPRYTPTGRVHALSNLDLYAVSKVFAWASSPVIPGVTNICPRSSTVTLPPAEEFTFLPTSSSDLPPQPYWETLVDRLLASSRYMMVTLVVFAISAVGLGLMAAGIRRHLRRPPEAPESATDLASAIRT